MPARTRILIFNAVSRHVNQSIVSRVFFLSHITVKRTPQTISGEIGMIKIKLLIAREKHAVAVLEDKYFIIISVEFIDKLKRELLQITNTRQHTIHTISSVSLQLFKRKREKKFHFLFNVCTA